MFIKENGGINYSGNTRKKMNYRLNQFHNCLYQ